MRERLVNLFWLFVDQGGKVLCTLLITILVVNHLGVEDFGILSLSLSLLAALSTIVSLGMDPILFRYFISEDYKEIKLIATSVYLRLAVSIVIIVLATVINLLCNDDFLRLLNILVTGFLFDSFLSFKDYFAANLKNKYYTFSTLLAFSVQLIMIFVLVQANSTITSITSTYVIAKLIQVVSLAFSYSKINKKLILQRFDMKLAKELLVSSYPMMLASSVGILYSMQDQFFIKTYLGNYDVGIYVVGIKFVTVILILPTLISNIFYPSLVSKFSIEGKSLYKNQLQSIYQVFFILGVIVFLVAYFISNILIETLFSTEFTQSAEVMRIYSVILICSFFQSINNKVLILNNLQKIIFKRSLLALVINGALNFVMIPKYGVVGAAYSTVLSELFVLFSYILTVETRFIFLYQIRSIFLLNLFKRNILESLRT